MTVPSLTWALNTHLSTAELSELQTHEALSIGINYWDTTQKIYRTAISNSVLQNLSARENTILDETNLNSLKTLNQIIPNQLYWNSNTNNYEVGDTSSTTKPLPENNTRINSDEINSLHSNKKARPHVLYWDKTNNKYYKGKNDRTLEEFFLDTASCIDNIQNGNEEGVDCGGLCPAPCPTSCSDNIQNGDETGIDCGGSSCTACSTCSDNIQNGDEEGIDCGESCSTACITCSDNIQNGDEEGVDCGGAICESCPDQKYLIDFGVNNNTTSGNWNNVTQFTPGQTITLQNDAGTNSNISLSLAKKFKGKLNRGYSTIAFPYPDSAKKDLFYVSRYDAPAEIVFSNLDINKEYDFTFFGSRSAPSNRTTKFSIDSSTVLLNASYNDTDTVALSNIEPDINGDITISVTTGNSAWYGYLNVIEMTEHN